MGTVGRGVDSPEVQACTGAMEGHVTSQDTKALGGQGRCEQRQEEQASPLETSLCCCVVGGGDCDLGKTG